VRFEGGLLIVDTETSNRSARRITFRFASDYATCTANLIEGKQAGSGPIERIGMITGSSIYTLQHTTPSCSMTSGNVFGGD
jgi:hypothetical protein